jgi:hypothetical protein
MAGGGKSKKNAKKAGSAKKVAMAQRKKKERAQAGPNDDQAEQPAADTEPLDELDDLEALIFAIEEGLPVEAEAAAGSSSAKSANVEKGGEEDKDKFDPGIKSREAKRAALKAALRAEEQRKSADREAKKKAADDDPDKASERAKQEKTKAFRMQGEYGARKFIKP